MDRVRLKDIAESVGCSIAVASHVLNHSTGNISCRDELRERILRRAGELHYAPHYASRALRTRRSATLGVYVPSRAGASADEAGFYESRILRGVEEVCRDASYDLLLLGPGGGRDAEECAAKLTGRRIDGLVLVRVPESAAWVAPLVERDANAVAVNYFGPAPVDAINFDVREAALLAARALVRMGHRRIGCLDAPPSGPDAGGGVLSDGFVAALAELGAPADPRWTLAAEPAEVARAFAAAAPAERPTAMACASDLLAVRFLMELRRLGVECPRDVSLMGMGDGPLCETVFPTLSSVREPLSEMGAEAARRALRRFEERLAEDGAEPASPGPLPTELRTRGRRGRRPTAVAAAIAEEAETRARLSPPARRPPARERWLRRARPELVLRESSAPPLAP